ncbi:MAG TPA: hypothetical protein DIC36_04920 [Gammaproteobacteria bacterium]|nr:hypothetical protein [Gammaproteobacteria bacterium]
MRPDDTGGDPPERGGLLASLRQMFGTVLEIIQTRIEIVANEFEEEREHLQSMVLQGLVAFLLFAVGLLLLTLFVILLFWEEQRLVVIGIFAGVYLFLGIFGILRVRANQRRRPRLLSTTLDELRQDRDDLRNP